MKFLIVDDNRNIRETIKMMLGYDANEFVECDDGGATLELYKQFHPDWVLMDLRMKTVDGITATKKLTEQFPQAKVLMVTDYDDEKFRYAAFSAGAVAYITKEHLIDISLFIGNSHL